jgi:hypothetical protein
MLIALENKNKTIANFPRNPFKKKIELKKEEP